MLNLIFQEFLPAIKTILLYSLIPIIWWFFSDRDKNFFKWVGLKSIGKNIKEIIIWTISFFVITVISQIFIMPNILPEGITAAQQYAGLGLSAFVPALFFGLTTGIGEELFFRGFLGKKLCRRYGFSKGNLIQALLFGLIHGIGFPIMIVLFNLSDKINISNFRILTIGISATILGGFGGWILGYVTEKSANGSIIPAILIHGGGNFLLTMAEAFNLI